MSWICVLKRRYWWIWKSSLLLIVKLNISKVYVWVSVFNSYVNIFLSHSCGFWFEREKENFSKRYNSINGSGTHLEKWSAYERMRTSYRNRDYIHFNIINTYNARHSCSPVSLSFRSWSWHWTYDLFINICIKFKLKICILIILLLYSSHHFMLMLIATTYSHPIEFYTTSLFDVRSQTHLCCCLPLILQPSTIISIDCHLNNSGTHSYKHPRRTSSCMLSSARLTGWFDVVWKSKRYDRVYSFVIFWTTRFQLSSFM